MQNTYLKDYITHHESNVKDAKDAKDEKEQPPGTNPSFKLRQDAEMFYK